jgi:hypothetical protein
MEDPANSNDDFSKLLEKYRPKPDPDFPSKQAATLESVAHSSENLALLDDVSIMDDEGDLAARIGFKITLYFANGHDIKVRRGIVAAAKTYYEWFGSELINYYASPSTKPKLLKKGVFPRVFEETMEESPAEETVNINLIRPIIHDRPAGSPALYVFEGVTNGPLQLSCVHAHIPIAKVLELGYEKTRELVLTWCKQLAPIHGRAGLGIVLQLSNNSYSQWAFPFLKRFPGLDFSFPRIFGYNMDRPESALTTIEGTNWWTILNDKFVAKLDSEGHSLDQLGPDCKVFPYDEGILIQAGERPELGDSNRRMIPEAYRRVARWARPLRYENYRWGLFYVPEPLDMRAETLAWLARFD